MASVKATWGAWRLLLSDASFDYNTVFHQMTPNEIECANLAIDMQMDAQRKAAHKRAARRRR